MRIFIWIFFWLGLAHTPCYLQAQNKFFGILSPSVAALFEARYDSAGAAWFWKANEQEHRLLSTFFMPDTTTIYRTQIDTFFEYDNHLLLFLSTFCKNAHHPEYKMSLLHYQKRDSTDAYKLQNFTKIFGRFQYPKYHGFKLLNLDKNEKMLVLRTFQSLTFYLEGKVFFNLEMNDFDYLVGYSFKNYPKKIVLKIVVHPQKDILKKGEKMSKKTKILKYELNKKSQANGFVFKQSKTSRIKKMLSG